MLIVYHSVCGRSEEEKREKRKEKREKKEKKEGTHPFDPNDFGGTSNDDELFALLQLDCG